MVTPIPGTEFYDEMLEKGLIEEFDWSLYDLAHLIIRTQHLSRKQIIDLVYKVYMGFYKRPSKIIKHIILGDTFCTIHLQNGSGNGKVFLEDCERIENRRALMNRLAVFKPTRSNIAAN